MTILGKPTATMTFTAFNTSLNSTPVNSIYPYCRHLISNEMEIHIFPQRNENNLKGNFCLVLRKSCKPALDKATYFQTLSNQFILQINKFWKKPAQQGNIQSKVSMFISISNKVILKDFQEIWIWLKFWRQMVDRYSISKNF